MAASRSLWRGDIVTVVYERTTTVNVGAMQMPRLLIITKSHKRDLSCFIDLHKSVFRYSGDDVEHHVIVPDSEVAIFRDIPSPRLKVFPTSMFLQGHFRPAELLRTCVAAASRLPFAQDKLSRQTGELFFNTHRPWTPVRGWILQQLVKLAAVARSDADVVLTADSDVVLVRPISAETFLRREVVRFYSEPGSVHSGMTRHLNWWRIAHRLLGLSADEAINVPGYISAIAAWDPFVVRSMQNRIAEVSGRPWLDTLAREIDFSELVIHGVYVDRLCDDKTRSFSSPRTLCRSYWDREPLTLSRLDSFVEAIAPDDIAIHIQSVSNTSMEVRRAAIQAAGQRCSEISGTKLPQLTELNLASEP